METQTHWTVLLPVREGDIWRVQIVWPNGAVNHFGKFVFKEDAVDWITAHSRLTKPVEEIKGPPLVPSEGVEAGLRGSEITVSLMLSRTKSPYSPTNSLATSVLLGHI